jgi:hypothetical protein
MRRYKTTSYSIPKHSKEIPLQYTNKEKQSVHILRYATNQPSFFVEKQGRGFGSFIRNHFNYGRLKSQGKYQFTKFLAIHAYKDILFKEYDPKRSQFKWLMTKVEIKAGALVFYW